MIIGSLLASLLAVGQAAAMPLMARSWYPWEVPTTDPGNWKQLYPCPEGSVLGFRFDRLEYPDLELEDFTRVMEDWTHNMYVHSASLKAVHASLFSTKRSLPLVSPFPLISYTGYNETGATRVYNYGG
jgi:hypothetical protein